MRLLLYLIAFGRQYHEYLNQQRKIMEAQSLVGPLQMRNEESYQKVKYELRYEFHRLKQKRLALFAPLTLFRAKQIEEENQKMYNRLKSILTVTLKRKLISA